MKKARMLFAAAIIVSALCLDALAQPAGSPVAIHGRLSVKDGRVVDQNGFPVQLRGMSFGWNVPGWESEKYYTSGVTNWLVDDWKVSIVRVAVAKAQVNNSNFETVISAATAKGIYVLIDFHTHNHNDKSDAQAFFKRMSDKYRNSNNILYEIFNEPCEPNKMPQAGCTLENATSEDNAIHLRNWNNYIRPYAVDVVNTIRNNNDQNIIVIGSGDASKRVDIAAQNPLTGPNATNLVYTIHYYTAEPGTDHTGRLRAWSSNALNAGLALMATEWGVSEADGGQRNPGTINLNEANTWFDFLDRFQISWMNWQISDKGEAAAALRGGAGTGGSWNSGNLSPSGTYVRGKTTYYANKYQLTTRVVGIASDATGTVTVKPNFPANYGGYPPGYPIDITGAPNAVSKLAGFEAGDDKASTPTLSISMPAANRTVTAVFDKSANLVRAGTFTNGVIEFGSTGAAWQTGGSGGAIAAENYELKMTATSPGTNHNDVRVNHGNISLEQNSRYRLSFRARAQSARTIVPKVTSSTRTQNYMDTAAIQLTTTMQPFTREFNFTAVSVNNAALSFNYGGNATTWFLDDVLLEKIANNVSSVTPPARTAPLKTVWSLARTNGGLQLTGPAEAGAKAMLYDTRGRAVRTMAAKDGMTIGTGLPSGNYLLVVKNGAGSEVFSARVLMAR